MMKKLIVAFIIFILPVHFSNAQKVGLVFSGGGAKGAVHIGIIKALEENDIPIDYISGTSIGAIIGSLYAIGYTPDEMLNLFFSKEFYYWQTGKVEKSYQYYFLKGIDVPAFAHFSIPLKDSIADIKKSLLPNSLIDPIQMNQAFMQMYAQANAYCDGDFDRLFVPFLCIASDVYNKKPVIFRNGDLGDAVRASMSFPLFFKPIIKDDIPLWDGGIYDNFPIRPMKQAWHPDFIIGSSVAGNSSKKPADQNLSDQLENIVMQKTEYRVDSKDGILMNFKLTDVGLLDFYKAKELCELGYTTTMEKIDEIKKRVKRRVPLEELQAKRAAFKSNLPPLIFQNIYITSVTNAQKQYIENQIHRSENQYFTLEDFKQTYFRLLSDSKINEIIPHAQYNPDNQNFDLYLDIKMQDEITVGFGGNISSMSANQIYLGVGYKSLSKFSTQYNFDMQLGNAYNGVTLLGRVEMPYKVPLNLSALFAYHTTKYYEPKKLFIDTDLSTFINQREAFGKLGMAFPFRNNAKINVLIGYGVLDDQYYVNKNYTQQGYDRSQYKLLNIGTYYRKHTLDAKLFPINGQDHFVYLQYITGKESYLPLNNKRLVNSQSYLQINTRMNFYHSINKHFNIGYLAEGVVSNKQLWDNYSSSILQAPGFTPTPHSKLIFNEAFHANQYLAGGLIPIWKLNSVFHLRGDFYGFFPIYPIKTEPNNVGVYGPLFDRPAVMGEISLVARLPFMSVSLFANYYSYPANDLNFGLNIGYLIFGPKFIP